MLEGTLASKRACQLAPAVATARRNRVDRSSSVSVRQSDDLAGRPVLGAVLVHREAERAEGGALHEGGHPVVVGDGGDRGGDRVRVRRTPGQGGAGTSQVGGGRLRRHRSSARASGRGSGRSAVLTTGSSVTSPVAPWASVATSISIRSVPRSSASSAAPGPRVGPSSPGSTATATTAAPASRDGGTSLSANWGGETCGGSGTHKTLVSRTRACTRTDGPRSPRWELRGPGWMRGGAASDRVSRPRLRGPPRARLPRPC